MAPDRSVYFVNDLISFRYPEYFTLKTRIIESVFTRLALRRVGRIVAISNSTARDIERISPGAGKRTTVVHLAADPVFGPGQPDPEVLHRLGLPGKYILTVGTIEPRKNHLALIRAYEALPEKLRSEHGLVIVGKRGWKCGRIMQAISRLAADGNLRYLEYIGDADLAQVYRGASLFVYPSLYEGFGLPVLEAMRCRVPVITSNNSSLPEVGGDSAFYVDSQNPSQLARSMERILSDQKLAREMSANGLGQSSKFSWHKAAQKFYEIIDSIV
jgi:alpha-1,3-rhamnosyl/mannosyltransferase